MIFIPYYDGMNLEGIHEVYQKAFSGFPWFESLTIEEVERRWKEHSSQLGFSCYVACTDETCSAMIGISYFSAPHHTQLVQQKGKKLGQFVSEYAEPDVQLIWYAETCVLPEFQEKGVARKLKKGCLGYIENSFARSLVLTRMRDDNLPIIHLNTSLGFQRTGVRVPSSQKPDVFHEFWYLQLGKEKI